MKILICGAGRVGGHIAGHLASEGNDVTVIDKNPDTISDINQHYDVATVLGHASHPDTLKAAGAEKTDLIIATTQSDEINMLICQVAYTIFKIPKKIARIRSQTYRDPMWANLFGREHMPVDFIISPETEIAKSIVEQLSVPGAFSVINLEDEQVRIVSIICDEECPVLNTPLRHFSKLFPDLNFKVITIIRNNKMFIPEDTDQILNGDKIYFISHHEETFRIMALFGKEMSYIQNVLIMGGGTIGESLIHELTAYEHTKTTKVKLIENNKARARYLSEKFPSVLVLHGDALDMALFEEANIANIDTAITITNDDKVNILSGLLAKEQGVEEVISLINNAFYSAFIDTLKLDSIINPRAITVSKILRHIRRGKITDIHQLYEKNAEVLEIEATESSPIINIPLKDLGLPKGVMVAAIIRKDTLIIPFDNHEIKIDDRVIIVDLEQNSEEIEHLFTKRFDDY